MKWIFLFVEIVSVLPFAGWLRRNPAHVPKVWVVVGFLLLKPALLHVDMAVYSWAGMWRGYVQGIEVYFIDFVLLAIYISLPSKQKREWVPFLIPALLYFFAVLLSVFQAGPFVASLFYLWQIARIIFAFVVISKACSDDRVPFALVAGMGAAICWQVVESIWQRFGLGNLQASGTVGSQNMLGMLSHFVLFPAFALALAGFKKRFYLVASAAGVLVAVLTTSRATVAATVLGLIMVFVLSGLRGWTPWKSGVALLVFFASLLLTPFAISQFEARFSRQAIEDTFGDTSRTTTERAANAILSDHPMGVGANQYTMVANTRGYNAKARVDWHNSVTPVHNSYLLVAAETGYLGVFTLLLWMARPLVVALLCGYRNRKDVRADLLMGVGVGLLTVYLHSLYEWLLVTAEVQYFFAASIGIVAGVAKQLGYWSRARNYYPSSRSASIPQVAREAKLFHASSIGKPGK